MLKTLNQYKKDGWLISQSHPTLPLTIWNYSKKTQFERKWDEITIMCRGLVTWDETGEIVARPFKKFWNFEENKHTPTKNFEVFEKMDGSLIIVFTFWGMRIAASRGSFTSDQAIAAQKIIDNMNLNSLNIGATYLFEYTSPANRIVVDYGSEEKLTLLGAIDNEDGFEAAYSTLEYNSKMMGCDLVKKCDGIKDYTSLKSMIKDDAEGFVVKFSNCDRMKVKGDEYFRLHRIMTEISTTRVWGYLKDGTDIEIMLDNVPDEFYDKIKAYIKELKYYYMVATEQIGKLFDNYLENRNQDLGTPQEYSKFVNLQDKKVQGVLWKMYYRKDYSEIIWNLIKPKFLKL